MSNIQLSKLVKVPLREVWKHEASDFTRWLAKPENIEALSEVIGIDLLDPKAEEGVGRFYVDIVAKDENNRTVVIENQLETTNHDHLGKIITYAAGVDAEVVVWIVERAREEHEQAINWLNENTTGSQNFFLLQIEAWKIGDSLPAPRFNIIAKPNDWAKVVRQSAAGNDYSELKLQQQGFFERVREYGEVHAKHIKRWQTPRPQIWYNIAIGSSQAHVELTVRSTGKKQVTVQIYIPDNKELYAKLHGRSGEIEAELGMKLEWHELPKKKASRIIARRSGDIHDPTQVDELVSWMVTTADRFVQVFPGFLQS